jgi:hypothetical protein
LVKVIFNLANAKNREGKVDYEIQYLSCSSLPTDTKRKKGYEETQIKAQ